MIRVGWAVALLLLLAAGCVRAKPDTVASPKTSTTRPAALPTPVRPAATAKTAPAAGVPPVAKSPAAAAAPLDLKALTEQLKETKAIGIFTKITLKNQPPLVRTGTSITST